MKVKNIYYTFFVFIVLAIFCYPIVSTYAFENRKSDIYKNAIEYNCSDNINSYFKSKQTYETGTNALGKTIFIDTEKAFKQAMIDFKNACDYLETELQFGTVKYNWQIYLQQRAWSPDCEKELQEEIMLLFAFLDIYKNSFDLFY
ncbi:hypothetical protein AAK894_07115 [Lachnospiraceae bacterium 46-61]